MKVASQITPLPQKNKTGIYLLVVLLFMLLACGVYFFFECRIKAIEKESNPGYSTTHQIKKL